MKAPVSSVTEREIILPESYDHLRKYIFSTDFLETLKVTLFQTNPLH